MIYFLHEWDAVFSSFRVFQYITVRTFGAAGMAFILSLWLGGPLIRYLRAMKVGQQVRTDEILKHHLTKQGTPTMGGILIIISVSISVLFWARPDNLFIWLCLATMWWMGMIGAYDDYLKMVKQHSGGLNSKGKLLLQSFWLGVVLLVLWHQPETEMISRQLMVPFFKDPLINDMGVVFTLVFMYLVLVGTCNAVNLTDGMDGLAIGCSNAAFMAYVVLAYVAGNVVFADYLLVPYIPGTSELAVFCAALVGAGLGFLWWNAYPAKVFMGDTGSLAIGGSLAMVAIIIKHEITLIIVGGIFFVEALSVVLQVARFKLTGKRFFRCSPIHHHFELLAREQAEKEGRPGETVETMVVIRFWIVAIVFAVIGVATLKLR